MTVEHAKPVAIVGATGYIGGRLIPRLLEAEYSVRCMARAPEKLRDRAWFGLPKASVHAADLNNPSGLAKSLEGCGTAYYLVHSMTSAGAEYAEQDRRFAHNFAGAARQAGVERIIYLGGLGETGANLSEHLSSRREVETALGSSGIPVTVLRAAMIIGSGSASFEILRYLVERLPIMITPKWVSTLSQPIAVSDVIAYLIGALRSEDMSGGVFDIGGPEVLCYRDIMRIMAEELGLRRRWIIPVPVLTPRLSSYWIHLITPLSHDIAKPLAEGLRNPVVCREDRITDLIPRERLNVREAIRCAIRQTVEHEVETTWSMAGVMPGDPDWAGGAIYKDFREIPIEAPAWAVYKAVCRVGGGHGWYAADWLWRIRGAMDRLAGGPGLRRGRRDPEEVGYGEALDFWRVVGLDRDRRLALRAEMKLPGEAQLEFVIEPRGSGRCVLHQNAMFAPSGLFGILYWYAVLPLHHVVFGGMLRGIAREALSVHRALKAQEVAS